MPPRLPSRQCVELVQLGFLLPWASNSSRSIATLPTSNPFHYNPTPNQAESSKTASSRPTAQSIHSKQHGRLTTLPPSSRSSPPRTSFIHAQLSIPNPPPPSTLVQLVRADTGHLTLSSGLALSTYCLRMGDLKSYRNLWHLMGKSRIAPISMIRSRLSVKIDLSTGLPSVDGNVGKGKKMSRCKPNRWAYKMFPPLDHLASARYSTQDLLRHLHYLLLYGEPPSLPESIELLKYSVDRWTNGEARCLDLLNMYLAYDTGKFPSGLELVDIYLNSSHGTKVNRQTLHLLVKSHISATSPEGPEGSDNVVQLKTKILAIISHFSHAHKLTPGPETYRILAKFAAHHRLEDMANMVWKGWYDSIAVKEYQKRVVARCNLTGLDASDGDGDVKIRFSGIGHMNKRWTRVVKMYEALGWVRREEVGEKYVWVGEVGRLAVGAEAKEKRMQEEKVVEEKSEVVQDEIKVEGLVKQVQKEIKLEGSINTQKEETAWKEQNKIEDLPLPLPAVLSLASEVQRGRDEDGAERIKEEIKVNLNLIEDSTSKAPILQIVKEEPDVSADNEHHKPPYFVLIRDGSTVKIRSKAKDHEVDLDALDDKPIWE